jgi:IMP dehydrogenase
MDASLTFSDVLIRPKYSEVLSRSSVALDISCKLNDNPNLNLTIPVISSNMKTITGSKMAVAMSESGGLGIMHRFNTVEDAVKDYKDFFETLSYTAKEGIDYRWPGVSIGVQEEDKERFDKLYEAGARIFCIDVAHGHHILVKNMIKWIRQNKVNITLIAGNIATGEAVYDLSDWGANIVKVGIGPGAVCVTRQRTGVGVPQLSALREVREEIDSFKLKTQILADGGIVQIGDIPKALKYAHVVMLGSILSGTSETPGKVFRNPEGQFYKTYGGSASGENKNTNRFVEGMVKTVPFRGHVKYILREIDDGIRSAFSYVGAFNLKEFQEKCEFIHISSGGAQESKI